MSTAGMNNFKGLDYQTWSAVLLFLMRSREVSFDSIILEDKNWEDFTLVYADGKKIICESKYYAHAFTASNLLRILQNITASPDKLNEKDEILIVCPTVSSDLEERIKHLRWYTDHQVWFTNKGYSKREIELLSRVSFFKPESAEFLYEESLAYFYNHPKLAGAWLPRADVERWLDSIVMNSFFRKATKGEKFTREQLSDDVDSYYDNELDKNVEYDRRQTEIPTQFKSILSYVRNRNENQIKRNISAWTIQPDLMYFVIQEIFSKPQLKLAEWDIVWSKIIDRQYSFRVVYDFKDHIKDRDNAAYTIELFANHTDAFTNPAFDDFRAEFAMQTMELILKEHPDLSPKVYDFIEAFLKDKRVDYTELDDRSDRQEKVEVAKLLVLTFEFFQSTVNQEYINKTVELVSQYFNLIDDDGEYDIYTPSPIFNILYKYLNADFTNRIEEVIGIIVHQYQNAKIYGSSYNGWDGMGGGVSQSGDHFSLSDRHYIQYILQPALNEYYLANQEDAWKLINERFVSKDSKVATDRPDFLNRAALHVILQEYGNGPHSDDALKILQWQVVARKGIPSKHELIFQMLRDNKPLLSNDKKWALIDIFLKKYTLPYSVFVEQIVSSLALDGDERALSAIVSWMDNPEYRKRQVWHSFYVGSIMTQLLSADSSTKLFSTGVDILTHYLSTKEFTHELGSFDSYDISRTIAQVIERDYDSGLKILRNINQSSSLTRNQQTATWLSIEQVNKENKNLIAKLYRDFVKPVIYDELGADNSRIEARLTEHYPRQLIVQFGEHLAKQGLASEALEIARIFIKDSHPRLENDPDDPKGQSNYHQKILNNEEDARIITTVRGWVAWILASLISIKGKEHLEEVAQMTEELVNDENLYVVTQGMIPLTSLMQNRHSVLPKTDHRFISRDLSDRIENLALELVDKHDNKVVLHHLEAVLHRFRTMTTNQAMHVFKRYGLVDNKAKTDDIYTLLISFALFRKDFFADESFKKLFGEKMYRRVNDFDDKPFKNLLNKLIDSDNDEARTHIAWFFWTLPKKGSNYEKDIDLSFEYLDKIADRYTREAFNRAAYFVNDRIKERPNQSLRLWEKITRNEQAWISENYKKLERSSWWSHHYNDDFLITAKELAGDKKYLEMLEIILSYPEGYQPMFKPQLHYDILKQIHTDEAQVVLDKLKIAHPSLYAKDVEES